MPAVYLIRAGVVAIIFILIWSIGSVVLFSTGGVQTVTDNLSASLVAHDYFGGIGEGIKTFWVFIFPIIMAVLISVYILIASHMWEPT